MVDVMSLHPETMVISSGYDHERRQSTYVVARGGKETTVTVTDREFAAAANQMQRRTILARKIEEAHA